MGGGRSCDIHREHWHRPTCRPALTCSGTQCPKRDGGILLAHMSCDALLMAILQMAGKT